MMACYEQLDLKDRYAETCLRLLCDPSQLATVKV